jgi:hypothetical protein
VRFRRDFSRPANGCDRQDRRALNPLTFESTLGPLGMSHARLSDNCRSRGARRNAPRSLLAVGLKRRYSAEEKQA